MARELDYSKPLTKADVAYLRQRYSEPYVQRQIDLAGGGVASDVQETPEKPDEEPKTPEAPQGEAKGADGSDSAGDGADGGGEPDDADLIGDLGGSGDDFDVTGSTETEVKAWAESATDEAKAAALATEQAREDREPRKGVVSLLS